MGVPVRAVAVGLGRSFRVPVLGLALLALACGVAADHRALRVASDPADWDAELIARFKSEAAAWIRAERERHRASAEPLSPADRQALEAFFPESVLDRARVATVEGFDNPGFFSVFDDRGEAYPLDLRRASGMALGDTILLSTRASRGEARERLLFHELVHVIQYEALGVERYMDTYVDGWVERGSYRRIPHEEQAFTLAARFGQAPEATFSVEEEVRRGLASVVTSFTSRTPPRP